MTFEQLELIEPIQKALTKEGYTIPTPIQAEAIPYVLDGYDLLGCAQTGTGKTAAFSIPIIQNLYNERQHGKVRGIKALILTPTRELAIQIGESFTAYGKYTGVRHTVIFGGVGQKPQTDALERGVDVLIATPGRLLDLINQGFISLKYLDYFVLDEADRMLDMGFIHDIKRILPLLPKKRQSLFFSATMPPEIERLAGTILHEPQKVEVTPASSTVDKIDQSVYFVEKAEKVSLLTHLLKDSFLESVLVFTRTKHGADKVARVLAKANIGAEAIHGNKSQTARQRALTNFKDHTTRVLIATDIAARGIDVDHLSHVINYELPNVPETYVHRIGRTGRAGRSGVAYSFCDAEEVPYLKDIQKLIGKQIPVAGGNEFETADVKAAVAEKKEAIKQESKRRNMFGSKRDGSFWRNKKRAEAGNQKTAKKKS
ncbi:DEAD/DEAH box family ATP-dependent RNA helicase [Parabacteroides goldsteinii]|uniref:DEAD/DEAH box helicase n=1 Tax=Parabacteroides goldsteinii TaxID=328812 RepID=UPI001FBBF7FE|nr:DEAD/DEAH box helicase [Parabacteroides goldsteinii]GKG75755.1 DEAD/DEAH box family ATP-dependent RNA helicase [Parabacteroides goldsteinii]GKG80837.1 DEAD/DEAH box family ATP-dependent RNA helicase [Parabacteroides goldsteinii]